jgi:hypothetical protein
MQVWAHGNKNTHKVTAPNSNTYICMYVPKCKRIMRQHVDMGAHKIEVKNSIC